VLHLRTHLGTSRQVFATGLGVAMSSVQRWEGGQFLPTTAALVALARTARKNGRDDLAAVFEECLKAQDVQSGVVDWENIHEIKNYVSLILDEATKQGISGPIHDLLMELRTLVVDSSVDAARPAHR
jgi:transcriptional regulator with XRE-family HTH domain